MNLYQEMRVEQVPVNLVPRKCLASELDTKVTFNSLMDVCVRCGDLQAAAYFLQVKRRVALVGWAKDMMQMGIEPDLITFSTLIKGHIDL